MCINKIVRTKEDIAWAIKRLVNGYAVFCTPAMKKDLENEARKNFLDVEIFDHYFGYEFVPIGSNLAA